MTTFLQLALGSLMLVLAAAGAMLVVRLFLDTFFERVTDDDKDS